MSGSDRKPLKRRSQPELNSEDRSLWKHVSASVDRRQAGKPRVPDVEAQGGVEDQPKSKPIDATSRPHTKPMKPIVQDAAKVAKPSPRFNGHAKKGLPEPQGKAPQSIDRRKARRIAIGTIEIEARIDLHGMTQSAAHARLITFLQSAASQGFKTVLVITGKGGARQNATQGDAWWDSEDVGILRRSVPRWLIEAPLRSIVMASQTAALRHGGEGALYVLLRRRRHGDRA